MHKKAFLYLDRSVEISIFVIFAVMAIIGGLQVFNRYVLNQSLSWSEEFQKFAHIWLIFLTIPVGYNRGSHIGMKLLVGRFPQKIQVNFALMADFMWLGFATATIFYTTVIMGVAKNQTSPGLGVRMDWVYLGLVIGGSYLAIVAVRKIADHLSMLISGEFEGE